jgi:hypothetical protein
MRVVPSSPLLSAPFLLLCVLLLRAQYEAAVTAVIKVFFKPEEG